MADKSLHTLKEIAAQIGVHKNTVRNKIKEYAFLFAKNKRKHFYNEKETAFVKSLFNVE